MYCEKHDEVDYWACPHCLDEANAKMEKLREFVRHMIPCECEIDMGNVRYKCRRCEALADTEEK